MRSDAEMSVHIFSTHWGPCAILLRGENLVRIYTAAGNQKRLIAEIRKHYGNCPTRIKLSQLPRWAVELTAFLRQYYGRESGRAARSAGQRLKFTGYLDWSSLSDFDRQVLQQTAGIHRGQTRTYGDLAAAMGKPGAARAVGAALGRNPWPVLIPCHRVVGANGKLVGFSGFGGVSAKKRMLAMERPPALLRQRQSGSLETVEI